MPYHILLVDDDADFREEFKDCLQEDYRVEEASNGSEAVEALQRPNEIDLVILDVVMPGERGTDLLQRMKALAPHLRIIISTGYSSKEVAVEALKGGADDYIEKPIDVEKTLALIASHLKKTDGLDDTGEGAREKVEHVKTFLERNYDKKVFLRDAAKAVCLSPKYLSRIFEEHAGVGFSEYRLRVKVEKAKQMLQETGANVDQISSRLGYENAESFIKVFRRFTGETPAAYRKSHEPDS